MDNQLKTIIEVPNILYTGTGIGYVANSLNKRGTFEHSVSRVCLSNSIYSCTGYALQRSKRYHDSPCVLTVNTNRISESITQKWGNVWEVKEIPSDAFLPYILSLSQNIVEIEEEVHDLSGLLIQEKPEVISQLCYQIARANRK